jgi:hypothetical protein
MADEQVVQAQQNPEEEGKQPWQEPKLTFIEPKLTKHGKLEAVTAGFFGPFSP